MGRLTNTTAVILGASAEGGTGWRTAELFAREGANLVVAARNMSGIESLARKIGASGFRCDTSKEDDVCALAEFAAEKFGGYIDIAVNAAGQSAVGTIETLDLKTLQGAVDVNYFGQLYFVRQMAAKMKAGGSIVSILSQSINVPMIGVDAYAFAKSAAMNMVRYAALEYAGRGIRINAIVPGLIDTPMAATVVRTPAVYAAFVKEIPLKAAVDPMDIAQTALWLSADVRSVTGEAIFVDGGSHLGRMPRPEEMPTAALDGL